MRPADVMNLAGCTRITLGRWIREGKLRWHLSAAGRRCYDEDEVRAFLAQHRNYSRNIVQETYVDKFTSRQAAAILGVSDQTIRRLCKQHRPPEQTGMRWLSLTRSQIDELAKRLEVAPAWPGDEKVLLGTTAAQNFLGCTWENLREWDCAEFLIPVLKTKCGFARYSKQQLVEFAHRHHDLVHHSVNTGRIRNES